MVLIKMQEVAVSHPDKIALRMKEGDRYGTYTYRELIRSIGSLSRALAKSGIQPGDRVLILSENRTEWVIAYFSVVSLGAVIVPLDAQLSEKEIAVILANAEPKAIFVSGATARKLPGDGPFAVISFDDALQDGFQHMLTSHPDAPLPPAPAADALAAILYTSGTTGDPKGVMLTHGNLVSNCASIIKLNIVNSTDNLLCILPLHHTYPAMVCMILPLSLGATMTILNSIKGPEILACMQETGVSILVGVPQLFAALRRAIRDEIRKKPALVRGLVQALLFVNGELRMTINRNIGATLFRTVHAKFGPQVRLFASGGARLEPEVYTDLSNLGFTIIEGYGLTETSPVCTFSPLSKQKPGSIGIPVPEVDVRIADPDQNGMGEIIVRGPNVMAGYYKKPEETKQAIQEGWFHTGDLGYRDRDGYFFVTGRSKEMIVLSTGKKIFPEELEAVYKQIPSIQDFCLVRTERGIEAAVVPRFDYLRKMNIANSRQAVADAIEKISRNLPPYKRVLGIKLFKDPLPVTRLGKLRRALILDLYIAGEDLKVKPAQGPDRELLMTEPGRTVLSCLTPLSAKKAIMPDDNLELDLGLDSLGRVEFIVSLEQVFGIHLPETFGSEVLTVRDVLEGVQKISADRPLKGGMHGVLSWKEILNQDPPTEAVQALMLDSRSFRRLGKHAGKLFLSALFSVYGRMTVRGLENLPEGGPFIIAPNHVSYADAPIMMAAVPWPIGSQTYFLGATMFFSGPITSRIAKLIHVIPVDMDAKLVSALQLSAYVLRREKILCVFPEGARSHDGRTREFKKGIGILARELNLPIIPTAIHGTYSMLPVGKSLPRPAPITVSFGKPVYPGEMNYEEIVRKVHDIVITMLQK